MKNTHNFKFHAGHAFSEAMPEITHVKQVPLADCVWMSDKCGLDEYVDRLENLILNLSDQDIGVEPAFLNKCSDVKLYLLESLSAFYESQIV